MFSDKRWVNSHATRPSSRTTSNFLVNNSPTLGIDPGENTKQKFLATIKVLLLWWLLLVIPWTENPEVKPTGLQSAYAS